MENTHALYGCAARELKMALQFKGLSNRGRKDDLVERAAEAGFKDYDDVIRFLKEMHPWPVLPFYCRRHRYAESLEERHEMLREERRNGSPHNWLELRCAKCGMLRKWTPSRPRKKAPTPKPQDTIKKQERPTGRAAPMFNLRF